VASLLYETIRFRPAPKRRDARTFPPLVRAFSRAEVVLVPPILHLDSAPTPRSRNVVVVPSLPNLERLVPALLGGQIEGTDRAKVATTRVELSRRPRGYTAVSTASFTLGSAGPAHSSLGVGWLGLLRVDCTDLVRRPQCVFSVKAFPQLAEVLL
jgi:hypothetical protein